MRHLSKKTCLFERKPGKGQINNHNRTLSVRGLAVFFFLGIILVSCRKPEDDLGLGAQPSEDLLNVNVIDSVTMITYSIKEDSLRTDELSRNLIGSYVDPEFGKLETASYFQLRTSAQSLTFTPDSIVVDSVVLSLVYDSYYGSLSDQNFVVYEVLDDFYLDSLYYTNSSLTIDNLNNLIEPGFETLTPDPFTELTVGSDTALAPMLRLRLRNSVGESFIQADPADLETPEDFVAFFKGVFVGVNNQTQAEGDGAILYFDPIDSWSKLTVYYRDRTSGIEDTTSIDFNISDQSARFTVSAKDYSGRPASMLLADSTLGQQEFYVQTLGGLKGAISFPHLEDFKETNIIINKAELIIPVSHYTGSQYNPSDRMFLVVEGDSISEALITDYFEGDGHIDGFYDDVDKQYRFLVTRYVQRIIAGTDENKVLRILPTAASVSGNKVILNGPNSINREKPRLELSYTLY